MTNWLIYALLSVAGLTGYRIAIKFIGLEKSALVIMTVCSFLYFCAWLAMCLIYDRASIDTQLRALLSAKSLLVVALAASFFVSDYFLLRAYVAGAKISVMTVLLSLSMLTTIVVGFFLFGERLTWVQALGVVFGVLSFVMLAFPQAESDSKEAAAEIGASGDESS
jgi:drug/metabolite transporter (DMT)-like permease